PVFKSRDLVELLRAGQFERPVALDVSTNRHEFITRRSERPADYCALRDRPAVPIDNTTSVGVWRRRCATSNDGERCYTYGECLKPHTRKILREFEPIFGPFKRNIQFLGLIRLAFRSEAAVSEPPDKF